jgi:hypothetical protein
VARQSELGMDPGLQPQTPPHRWSRPTHSMNRLPINFFDPEKP